MAQLKNLTRAQKEILMNNGIALPENWMLVEQTDFYLKIEHRLTHSRKRVDRYALPKFKK